MRSKVLSLVTLCLAASLLGFGWARTREFKTQESHRLPTVAGWALKFDVSAYDGIVGRPGPDTAWYNNDFVVRLDVSISKGKKDTLLGLVTFPLIDTMRVVQVPGGRTDILVPNYQHWYSTRRDDSLVRKLWFSRLDGREAIVIPRNIDSAYLEFDVKMVTGEHGYSPEEHYQVNDTLIQVSDSVVARFPMRLKFIRHESKSLAFIPFTWD